MIGELPVPISEVPVTCAGRQHRLAFHDGTLSAVDHPDADRERALVALGADAYACLELLDAWARHADDLAVLTLASRGPADPLPEIPDPEPGKPARPGTFVAHSGSGRSHGWTSYAALGQMHGRPGLHPMRLRNDELTRLVTRPGLGQALVARVATTWANRISTGDERVVAAMPRLHAALYGRLLAQLRSWLGRRDLVLDLALGEPDEPATLTERGSRMYARVPFSWLRDVWLPGTAVILGRFCLAADAVGTAHWRLRVVPPDLSGPETIEIRLTESAGE